MSESSGESGDELSELERTGAAVAFRRSVVDRAKNAAKNDPGLSTNDRIRLFTYQRLLDRLFTESSAGSDMWVLKGATLGSKMPSPHGSTSCGRSSKPLIHPPWVAWAINDS